jgi:ribosome-associated protein
VEDNYNDENEYSGPSKSQLKREMTALQDLGAELVELSRERLAKIEMPERLRDALLDAQRFTKHEARRRQMQYIGKIMRDIDAAPLRAAMDEIKGLSEAANIRQHQLERLRTRLMEDEAIFSEVASEYPGADIQHLRQLRRNAIKEAQQGKPPRAYRELFRELRELVGQAGKTRSESDSGDEAP